MNTFVSSNNISQHKEFPLERGEKGVTMGKMSREKGKRFEREVANWLKSHGFNCRRGQQYCGANGDADVVGLPGIHIECKHVERLNVYDAMSQAIRDAKDNEKPVVIMRKNNCEKLVIMRADDWIEQYREAEAGGLYGLHKA